MRDWIEKGKDLAKWGFSRRDYLSIKRVLDLEKKGEIKLCSKCKKTLRDHFKELEKTPYRLCKFCDSIIGIQEDICSYCNRSQN